MVGMAPVSLAILHHLKASYDPPKKNCQSAHPRLNFRILESLGSPSPFHQCKLELSQRPKRSRRPKVCKIFWMVKFRVFSSPPKAKLIFELKASTWSIPHDCFIQAAVPNALHSPGLSYSPWQPTKPSTHHWASDRIRGIILREGETMRYSTWCQMANSEESWQIMAITRASKLLSSKRYLDTSWSFLPSWIFLKWAELLYILQGLPGLVCACL